MSDPVDKFSISGNSFVHSSIGINRQQAVRNNTRSRKMGDFNEGEIKSELDMTCSDI